MSLIFNNEIIIPETEIRKGKIGIFRRGVYETQTQCSKYGFRSVINLGEELYYTCTEEKFPSILELEETCNAISDTVLKMEMEGILPTIYIRSGKENDEFGRGFIKYKDYKGGSILLSNSSQFIKSGMPLYKNFQLILPNLHINNSVDKLRFNYLEKTRYSGYWNDFPRCSKKDGDKDLA